MSKMNVILRGGECNYLSPMAEILEVSAEYGFADSAIYKDPDFGWDEDDDNEFE